MSAIDHLFTELRSANQCAFMPFVTAGDPDLDFTAALLQACAESGAHLCEVGIPYSDPIADGPVIQASYTRALDQGTKLEQIFTTIKQVAQTVRPPLVSMVSFGIVRRVSPARYVEQAKQAGFSGLIIPDLPVEEASEMAAICSEHDVSLIQLIAPTTSESRAVEIAKTSSGFIYFVSVTGITGERRALPDDLASRIEWLKNHTDLPVCVGFGVSQPEQAAMLSQVADGVIVGSAIVRKLGEGQARETILAEVSDLVASMVTAIQR